MADSAPESLQSDILGLRHISSSLFSIPGFIVGLGTKCLSDSDSVRSPTSPLDLKVLSNLSNPFGLRSPRTKSQSGHQKKWDCNKVGFGIVDSLVNEGKPSVGVLDSPRRSNVIFGAHVKTSIHNTSKHYLEPHNSSVKSNSLPKNYIFSSLPKTRTLYPQLGGTNVDFGNEGGPLESEPTISITSCLADSTMPSSLHVCLTQTLSLSSTNFCSENKTTTMSSGPVISHGSEVGNSLGNKPSSLPISIGSNHELPGSLSARDIELSEDYTCIISHGPNPKTTHIFGDCVLDCHTNELANFGKKEESGTNLSQVAKTSQNLTPPRSDKILSFCCSCSKRLEDGEDIYIYRFFHFSFFFLVANSCLFVIHSMQNFKPVFSFNFLQR
jgi:hypothetical protein